MATRCRHCVKSCCRTGPTRSEDWRWNGRSICGQDAGAATPEGSRLRLAGVLPRARNAYNVRSFDALRSLPHVHRHHPGHRPHS
jgi:hypothetical protein